MQKKTTQQKSTIRLKPQEIEPYYHWLWVTKGITRNIKRTIVNRKSYSNFKRSRRGLGSIFPGF